MIFDIVENLLGKIFRFPDKMGRNIQREKQSTVKEVKTQIERKKRNISMIQNLMKSFGVLCDLYSSFSQKKLFEFYANRIQ